MALGGAWCRPDRGKPVGHRRVHDAGVRPPGGRRRVERGGRPHAGERGGEAGPHGLAGPKGRRSAQQRLPPFSFF